MFRSQCFILMFLFSFSFLSTAQADDLAETTAELRDDIDRIFSPANENNLWKPYTSWAFKPGNNRVMGDGQIMMPLWQDSKSLIFADLRGQLDDSSSYEGNWGLGMRTITDSNIILGAYGFYDLRRTENDNNFSQVTFGLEAMTVDWEARINGYLPEDKAKAANGLSTAEFSGGTIFVRGGFERAYYGADAEVGKLLQDWDNGDWELRGFAGAYHFNNSAAGFQNISGPRFRLELRGYDLDILGEGSRITLGAEYQWDQVRNDQVTALLQIRIPLGRPAHKLDRLQRRMLDRIVRDVDVVANQGRGNREIALDAQTNQQLTNLTLIDANTANVPGAVTGAGATVIADGSQGTINTNASVVTNANQSLLGGGFQVVGSESGATAIFGSRPTINNSNNAADTVVVANDVTIRDLDVVGGRNGIATVGLGNLSAGSQILNNNVSNATDAGFRFTDVLGTVTDNTTTGSGNNGFQFTDVSGNFANNTATDSGGNGFLFRDILASGTVTGNTATDSGVGGTSRGFNFGDISGNFANNTATGGDGGFFFNDIFASGTVTGNIATGNEDDGFNFNTISGNFANNTATGSLEDGFDFSDVLAGGTFTGNTATGSTNDGFDFNSVLAGGTFASNTATGSENDGFLFSNVEAGGTFTGNTATSNELQGFNFTDVSGNFANNTATNSGDDGFFFRDILAGGTFTGNTATNSFEDGFRFSNVLAGGTFASNTATGNGRDTLGVITTATANGFRFNSNSGSFTNNMSIFNANNGFSSFLDNLFDQDAGTFTGNVANTNGDMGFRGNNNGGTVNTNTGTGNTNGGNTFP